MEREIKPLNINIKTIVEDKPDTFSGRYDHEFYLVDADTNSKIEFVEIIVNHEKTMFFYNLLKKAIECEATAPSEIRKYIYEF